MLVILRMVGHTAAWLLVLTAALLLMPRAFGLDDAYIALHSARVLVAGSDPIFASPALVGATSPAYVALIALMLSIRVPPFAALWVANVAGAVAFIAAAWALTAAADLPPIKRVIVVLVTLASGYVWLQLTNGLETGWAIAAIVYLI